MKEYKPNSHRYKEEQKQANVEKKKVEKVVTGTVKVKKKNGFNKFVDAFVADDISNVKSFVITDVLVPAVKKVISDAITTTIDMLLYPGGSGRRTPGYRADKVSYRDYTNGNRPVDTHSSRSFYSNSNIILSRRSEADEVLNQMDAIVESYGHVTVADLYDLIGKTCEYTDYKYGWTDMRNARVEQVRDGYLLRLPKALPID